MTRVFSDLRPAGMSLDDAMRLVARGEPSGLRAIYDLEASAMIGVAMRILRRRDLAEEAVHDCILQVWRKAASFDSARGQARAWLYTVLRNRALNILRGERKARTLATTICSPWRATLKRRKPAWRACQMKKPCGAVSNGWSPFAAT
jgi:RNA polymerase sigma factor (sigma-70 family)